MVEVLNMSERLNGEIVIIDDKPQGLQNLRKLLILERFDTVIVGQSKYAFSGEQPDAGQDSTDSQRSVGDAQNNSSILSAGDHQKIFIISLDLKSENPFTVLDQLQANYPEARYGFIGTTFDSKQAEDFFAAGVNAFFSKPISVDKFLSWVTNSETVAIDVHSATSNRAA